MTDQVQSAPVVPRKTNRMKFLVGGGVLLLAVAYLLVSNLATRQEYYITVNDLMAEQAYYLSSERTIRISGAVIQDTVTFEDNTLSFNIVHVPTNGQEIADQGGLAQVLETAVTNPSTQQLTIVMVDEPIPELLQQDQPTQAIVTGRLGEDGVFYANELLLKCPTRYEDAVPEQAEVVTP
jgi:cytochrome c-type biogenesis protein CcmE